MFHRQGVDVQQSTLFNRTAVAAGTSMARSELAKVQIARVPRSSVNKNASKC